MALSLAASPNGVDLLAGAIITKRAAVEWSRYVVRSVSSFSVFDVSYRRSGG
jgi:hypothetical protein